MQPFSRETIVDRRQPALRWSAILAGVALALGAWLVLQLLGTAVRLVMIDPGDLDRVHDAGGTSLWSLIAPIFALFLGGLFAGRLAGYHDRRTAGTHGLLVWAVGSIGGVLAIALNVSLFADGFERSLPDGDRDGARADLEQSLGPINTRLHEAGKPGVSIEAFVSAARHSVTPAGTYDRTVFITALDKETALDRTLAEQVVADLGNRAPVVISTAHALGQENAALARTANDTGKVALGGTVSLLLALVGAIGGAVLAARQLGRTRREVGVATGHPTAPYPVAESSTAVVVGDVDRT